MTLHHFLTLTATVPDRDLRRAIAAALASEVPHTPEAYQRFYHRVLRELNVTVDVEEQPGLVETDWWPDRRTESLFL